MKKKYSAPEIEIYKYSEMDVMTTSGNENGGEPDNPWLPGKSADTNSLFVD